jgi:uncharacterized protein (UPF0333 family)
MHKLFSRVKHLSKREKIQYAFAVILTAILVASVPVVAWFVKARKVASMIKINAPTSLVIGAGANEAAEMINLANIDVEEAIGETRVTYGRYVFSVSGRYLNHYDLQIARTTNIPFQYSVYRVSPVELNDEDDLESGWGTTDNATKAALETSGYLIATYEDSNAVKHYYPFSNQEYADGNSLYMKEGKISGAYLNDKYEVGSTVPIGKGDKTLDSTTFHEHNYGTYNYTNKYAEPLYWQATNLPVNSEGRIDGGYFVDYYVLVITWNESFVNNKETDMIYITAKRH